MGYADYIIETENHSYRISSMKLTKVESQKCGGILSLDCPDKCYSKIAYVHVDDTDVSVGDDNLVFLEK